MNQHAVTVGELLCFVSPELGKDERPPAWPPDAFALAATLVKRSGLYLDVVRSWPPGATSDFAPLTTAWALEMRRIGRAWRQGWSQQIPSEVIDWWKIVRGHRTLPVSQVAQNGDLRRALLEIIAATDEACHGVGVPDPPDDFMRAASELLINREGSTLCREIDGSRVRVLPKSHTPQTGMTLRSLTHHIALWSGSDVIPYWFPTLLTSEGSAEELHSLNLLVVPWPMRTSPMGFRALKPEQHPVDMPTGFGFFGYGTARDSGTVEHLIRIYEAARQSTDRIDGVVLPELAIDEADCDRLVPELAKRGSFLITGVGSEARPGVLGANRVAVSAPFSRQPGRYAAGVPFHKLQNKHHRWLLDRPQILQYGLGGRLDPSRRWWECCDVGTRELAFYSLLPWLSVCALVCEDLARQDPVAELVRAVGPNLVLALLMDGPQLPVRWPARYATVLADDPGCSVLTLTSLGMCELARWPGRAPSRSIGLWKDARSGEALAIDLPQGASGLILHLVRHMDEEWTADGRSDGGAAGFVILGGVHPVYVTDDKKW